MKTKLTSVLLLSLGLLAAPGVNAQETKIKVEREDYELKIKQDGDEFKYKEEGKRPARKVSNKETEVKQTTEYRRGETVTTVKRATAPKQEAKKVAATKKTTAVNKTVKRKPAAKKTSYAAKKKPVAKKRTTVRRSTAKAKPVTRTVVVHDTVYVSRVDTVFTINEVQSFTGNRPSGHIMDNFEELKIEREDGKIMIKKEYPDGTEFKREFDNEEEFQKYIEWKNF